MTQISAIDRLLSLPAIFRGADLTVRFEWTSKTASHYLYLWKRRHLVEGLGGHSDVFANMLVDRNPNWEQALLFAMPSGVIVGVEALRRAGWTTQIPQHPSVCVDASQSVFSSERFDVVVRDPSWFESVRPGVVGNDSGGVPMLSPAWALAEMIREAGWGACGLQPDDIEWSEVTEKDEDQWRKACTALDLPEQELMSLMESSRSHGCRF